MAHQDNIERLSRSSLGLPMPYDGHRGLTQERVVVGATVLVTAYVGHPEHFPA